MLENIEGTINNGQSRDNGNIGYTRRRGQTKTQHNTICVGHQYMQSNTNNVNHICLKRGGVKLYIPVVQLHTANRILII